MNCPVSAEDFADPSRAEPGIAEQGRTPGKTIVGPCISGLDGGDGVATSQAVERMNSCKEGRATSFAALDIESHSEDDWEDEDAPLPAILVEDNSEWVAMLAQAELDSLSKQNRKTKRGGGIALVPSRRSSRFL